MISVIMPTYNRPELFKEAVQSFIEQDYEEKELIVVNDGSDEEYTGIIYNDKLIEEYGITRIVLPENKGCPHALNIGIKESKGDLICVLADDDLLNGSISLSFRSKAFDDPKIDVVYTSAYNVDVNNKIISVQMAKPVNKDKIWKQDYINIQSMMWRRSVHDKIGYFSEDLINNEDWEWKIKCLMECNVKMLDILSVRSRYHGQNKSLIDRSTTNKCAHILLERMAKRYGKT